MRLSDFRGRKVVLYFYPKDDTSGCTTQACSFRDSYPEIEEQNAVVLGVSPDDAKSHQKFKTKYNLPFTLLVDQDHQIADQYGTWGEKSMYGKKYQGIVRSHFVINEAGEIVDVQYNVSAKDSADKALTSWERWRSSPHTTEPHDSARYHAKLTQRSLPCYLRDGFVRRDPRSGACGSVRLGVTTGAVFSWRRNDPVESVFSGRMRWSCCCWRG